jgi:hypothetical protein
MDPHLPPADPEPLDASGVDDPEHTFTAELWQWDARRQDTWTFVTVPLDITAAIEQEADTRGPRAGFGSVRVHVRIGPSTWDTSVFPDSASGQFVLPVKRLVRDANDVDVGDTVTVHLRVA